MKKLFFYIKESFAELYHFTNIGNLLNIIKNDEFITSADDGYTPNKYKYYISLTRMKCAFTGYPTGMIDDKIVRIVFNGKLANKYKIKPVDWGKAKTFALKSMWGETAFNAMKDDLMLQTNVEAEERVCTNDDCIKNISKYISKIETYKNYLTQQEKREIEKYCLNNNITFIIYDNEKDFKLSK